MDAVLGAQKKPHRAKARSIRGFFLPDESAPPSHLTKHRNGQSPYASIGSKME